MTEYVSGQITCTICGYEPLPVDESGQVKFQPNRRSRMLARRMQKLNEFGIFGDVNTSLLQGITLNCGYLNVEDRYGSDVQFCDRVHQEGRSVKDCSLHSPTCMILQEPGTRAQLSAGVAASAEHEHLLTKLVYFSHARGPEGKP